MNTIKKLFLTVLCTGLLVSSGTVKPSLKKSNVVNSIAFGGLAAASLGLSVWGIRSLVRAYDLRQKAQIEAQHNGTRDGSENVFFAKKFFWQLFYILFNACEKAAGSVCHVLLTVIVSFVVLKMEYEKNGSVDIFSFLT